MRSSIKQNQLLRACMAIAMLLLGSSVSIAQEAYRTETFPANNNVKIEVITSGGSIEMIGEDTDEVRVEMYVRKRGRTIMPEDDDLSEFEITIEKQGNKVIAEAKRDRKWGNWNGPSISFKVYGPVRSVSELKTSGGSIELTNLMGDQSARTSGGSITAERVGGDVELKTSGGSISLRDIEGRADVNTSGGRIHAENITGGILANTSGGSITLENITGDVDARTSGGSINAEVVNPAEKIELRTSGGSITVVVPREKGYDVDLRGNRVRADLENFRGEYDKNDIEGTLNGGGIKLYARTSGGSVSLRYF